MLRHLLLGHLLLLLHVLRLLHLGSRSSKSLVKRRVLVVYIFRRCVGLRILVVHIHDAAKALVCLWWLHCSRRLQFLLLRRCLILHHSAHLTHLLRRLLLVKITESVIINRGCIMEVTKVLNGCRLTIERNQVGEALLGHRLGHRLLRWGDVLEVLLSSAGLWLFGAGQLLFLAQLNFIVRLVVLLDSSLYCVLIDHLFHPAVELFRPVFKEEHRIVFLLWVGPLAVDVLVGHELLHLAAWCVHWWLLERRRQFRLPV